MSDAFDAAASGQAAAALLFQTVRTQATVIAFDTAFNAIALMFVAAIPVVLGVKIALNRFAQSRVADGLKASNPRSEG